MRITSIKSEYVLSELMQLLVALSKVWDVKVDYGDDEMQLEYKTAIAKSKEFEKQIRTFLLFSNWRKLRGRPSKEWVRVDIEKLLVSLNPLYVFLESITPHGEAEEVSFLYYHQKMEQFINHIKLVKTLRPEDINFWPLLHPTITKVARSRYDSIHYSDAVEAAFKEVIRTVKKIVGSKTGAILDGDKAMNRAFGFENQEPVIKFNRLKTIEEQDEQRGIMNLFKGMVGIRNRKAHENVIIKNPTRATEYLFLASLLMQLLDQYVLKKKKKHKRLGKH